jgi:LPS sulfotransferase NodH
VITVVSGLPRSGTSLLMQMLAAGGLPPLTDASRPADAGNPRGYFEYAPVAALARDSSWLAQADGRSVKVVVPLLEHLPPGFTYRVLLVLRDLDEVLASQAKLLSVRGHTGRSPELLRPVFLRYLEQARSWSDRRGVPRHEVVYADVLADPDGQTLAVVRFLELDLARSAMAAAVEPDLYRERWSAG